MRRGRPVLARRKRVKLTCEVCGKVFEVKESHADQRRFCSIACKAEFQKTALRGERNPFFGKTHSVEARASISKNHFRGYGVDNPNWRGGVTELKTLLRKSKRYKQWQMEVFRRDHFRSLLSMKPGQRWDLVAHHIGKFADILSGFLSLHPEFDPADEAGKAELGRLAMDYEPFWDVNNGMTLLRAEHAALHQSLGEQEVGDEDD